MRIIAIPCIITQRKRNYKNLVAENVSAKPPTDQNKQKNMLNRSIAPPIKDAIDYSLALKPYGHFLLNNGVPVYTIDAGAQDVLQIEMVFYAGNCFEKQKLIAGATNYLLKNGTHNKTAFQIN